MKIKELKAILETAEDENANIQMSIVFEDPYDKESTQDWFPIKLIDDPYRDPRRLSFEFFNKNYQSYLYKCFIKGIDNVDFIERKD